MSVLRGIIIALATFSQIPVPQIVWDEKSTPWTLAFLPLVGVCVGGVLLLWHALCGWLQAGPVFEAAGLTILPLVVSGAIHMDGFCDTADALASNAGPERRQEILHDSHTGAFAIIATGIYLVAFFGMATELESSWPTMLAFAGIFVVSRGLGGWASLRFTPTKSSSFSRALKSPQTLTGSTVLLVLWLVAGAALVVVAGSWPGVIALIMAAVLFCLARFWLAKLFDGFSGDLAGWLIQMTEVVGLASLVIGGLAL